MAKTKVAKRPAKSKKVADVNNATMRNPITDWLRDFITDGDKDSGVKVNGENVLGYAPVWSCVNKIAGHIGYLPVHLYERDREDSKKVRKYDEHVSYYAIASEPNPYMTSQTFKECIASDSLIYGNGRAWIQRDGRGQASSFIPLPAKQTTTILALFDANGELERVSTNMADIARYPGNWEKWHIVTYPDGAKLYIADENVLHIPGLTQSGLIGHSVVELAKQPYRDWETDRKSTRLNSSH